MRKLSWLLLLYAVAAVTYLIVTREDASAPPPVAEDHPADRSLRALKNDARGMVEAQMQAYLDEFEQRMKDARSLLDGMGEELTRAKVVAEGAARGSDEKIKDLHAEVKRLLASNDKQDEYAKKLAEIEKILRPLVRRVTELEARPVAPRVVAAAPKPDAPKDPPRPKLPEPKKIDPDKLRAAVAKAMQQLQSEKLEVLVLGIEAARKHGVREAMPRLVEILSKSKHDFARQAAAAAIGDLKDCDGVMALANALVDSSPIVAQQANRSIRQITGFDTQLAPTARIRARRKAKGAVIQWWRSNEETVRARLKQPRKGDAG